MKSEADKHHTVHFTGKVVRLEFEGGFWGLLGDEGSKYDPLDLPPRFQVEGLRVEGSLSLEQDIATIHMWGKPVRVLELKPVNSPSSADTVSPD